MGTNDPSKETGGAKRGEEAAKETQETKTKGGLKRKGALRRKGSSNKEQTTAASKSETADDGADSREFGDKDTEYYDRTRARPRSDSQKGTSTDDATEGSGKQPDEEEGAATKQGSGEKSGRSIYLMRHAERMDRIFPDWTKIAFKDKMKYRPYDLNQPLVLPKRQGGSVCFFDDPPITEMGYVTSQMVGRGMRASRVFPNAIYTSPALRCIQTGHGILKVLDVDVKMCVEPGLFEWLGWYQTMPRWLTMEELKGAGYKVDKEYKPIMAEEELVKSWKETAHEHYDRTKTVCNNILKKHKTPGPILIIGHTTTIDATSRSLLNRKATDLDTEFMDKLGTYYPYCCVTAVEETDSGGWNVFRNPLPHLTYVNASNKIDNQFFNRK